MTQRLDDGKPGERLEVAARLAQAETAELDSTNHEVASDEVIQRNVASHDIAAGFARIHLYLVVALGGFDGLGFDQGKFVVRFGLVEGAALQKVTVTGETRARNRFDFRDGMNGRLRLSGDMDGFDFAAPHWESPVSWVRGRRSQPLTFGTAKAADRIVRAQRRYAFLLTISIDSSSVSMATSASSLVTTRGGAMRTVLGPQPRNRIPRSNACSTIRSRFSGAYSLVF